MGNSNLPERKYDSVQVVEVSGGTETRTRSRANYAPFVTRTPFLLFICSIVLLCIGALQVALEHSVPLNRTSYVHKIKRQSVPETTTPAEESVLDFPTITTTTSYEPPPPPPPNSFLTITETNGSNPNSYLTITTTSIDYGEDGGTHHTEGAPSNDYGTLTSTATRNDYLTLTSGQILTNSDGQPIPTLVLSDGQLVTSSPGVSAVVDQPVSTVYSDGVPIATVTPPPVTSSSSSGSSTQELITYVTATTASDGSVSSVVVVAPKPSDQKEKEGTGGIIPTLTDGPIVKLNLRFKGQHYVLAMFAGTFISVILKILWACVYGGNKMMEPFYQLNKTDGALAKESLMADYLSSGISWWSLKVIFGGHWVMIFTLFTAFLIGILPPLASESMGVRVLDMCLLADGLEHPCNPVWVLNVNMVRVLQAVLSLIAFCILTIVFINLRRRSGINANPSSIATVASLLHHPDLLQEIRGIHENHSHEEVTSILRNSRYQITSYVDTLGQEHIGLTKTNVRFDADATHNGHYHSQQYMPVLNPAAPAADHPASRDRTDVFLDFLNFVFLLGLLLVIGFYWRESGPTPFNNFFNSNKFGPRFLLTSACSVIAMVWLDLEREVRIHTPYRALVKRNAGAKHTILASVDGSPHQSLFTSLKNRKFFHFLVAIAAVLSDILIIAVGAVPYNPANVYQLYVASTFVSIAVLAFMFLTLLGVFIWRWSNHRAGIPRAPNETLLKVAMSLANEDNEIRRMVGQGWSTAKRKDRDEHVLAQDARFWAGWRTDAVDNNNGGGNMRQRWIVDSEGPSRITPVYDLGR